tara:strand:+ start:14202 stop:17225 length:3024 start_codon:yes stop_codon:yes gene_type:complete
MQEQINNLSLKEIKKNLLLKYGVEGEIIKLYGELDLNFKVKSTNGAAYLLKISRSDFDPNFINYQNSLIKHINKHCEIKTNSIVRSIDMQESSLIKDKNNVDRSLRLLTWIDGRLWSSVNPIKKKLRNQLGSYSALISKSLESFDHNFSKRNIDWDISKSLWVEKYLSKFSTEQIKILNNFISDFKKNLDLYDGLEKSVIHNDINDNNIIVSNDLREPKIKSIIDFGDSVYSQRINDLAISCAYGIMNVDDPLAACCDIVCGYNKIFSISHNELKILYNLIAMRLVISVTKSMINKINNPENDYLIISEKPAWNLLKKWSNVNSEFAYFSFRSSCELDAHPNKKKFHKWAKDKKFLIKNLFPKIQKSKFYKIDLSVGSEWIGGINEIEDLEVFKFKIDKLQKENFKKIIAGGYLEPRSIYTSDTYEKIGNYGKENRTIHLGVDFWLSPGTKVGAIYDGEVITAINDKGNKEYGGLVILKHIIDDLEFYTLYGHNTVESVLKNKIGKKVKKGDIISEIANYPENGNWAPHLHFQIMLSMLNYKKDFPGVCYFNEIDVWRDLCPDPNLLFKSKDLDRNLSISQIELIRDRNSLLGKSLKLHYEEPLHIVRGEGVYLIDSNGRKYLDTVNNVAHVGHENESVVAKGKSQMAILNTNSRYLHKNINELSKELLKTLPGELSVVHFVNSGSEANELAIRMMKSHTKNNDIIVSEHGYHGNTNICVDISSYKFDGKGGNGPPENTHVIPIPNNFRGKFRGPNSAKKYLHEVELCIKKIKSKKRGLGGFIIEPILSCGGQVELPKGFLKGAYELVRKNGGICISDEVQVGCGRVGESFWGFEIYNVIPDIITIGKPLGNGHPIGAVVCTKEIAESFANGMEFFNTFGGNPVSCSIGTEVLKIVKREKLQENAKHTGSYLKEKLNELSENFKIIGDIRGRGLFLGIEFVDNEMNPLSEQTTYIVNRLKKYGILSSVDGPEKNVIKIKPPLTFNKHNCDMFIFYLSKVLNEDFLKN